MLFLRLVPGGAEAPPKSCGAQSRRTAPRLGDRRGKWGEEAWAERAPARWAPCLDSNQADWIRVPVPAACRSGRSLGALLAVRRARAVSTDVIVKERAAVGREGWVLKRYASVETPKKIIIEQLQNNYKVALKNLEIETEKALTFEKENKRLQAALNTSQEKLKNVKLDYTRLTNDSKDFLALQKKHIKNLANLKKATLELAQLRKENKALHSSTNIKWFITGAAVVTVSWLIGYVMGKIKRGSRSHSLYG